MNSNEVKQTEQDVLNPSDFFPNLVILSETTIDICIVVSGRIYASVNWFSIDSGDGFSLVGANPLPEPLLTYNQLDLWEQTSVKL